LQREGTIANLEVRNPIGPNHFDEGSYSASSRQVEHSMNEVTRILEAIDQGDPHAAEQLLPLVYEELRKLAAQRLAQEKPGQTLQATALVHEAYLRLVGDSHVEWDNRRHFFGAAAEAMRRILVEQARRKRRLRHGGAQHRIDLDEACSLVQPPCDQLLALDEALTHLASLKPVRAEVVELRFFAGLTMAEVAKTLGISQPTAERYWAFARTWLYAELQDQNAPSGA
jgi:RNA polymerase sigma factor (TIGR02999 family)